MHKVLLLLVRLQLLMEWILILVEILIAGTLLTSRDTITVMDFTGASIGGLQSTINAGVDVHLNKTTANNGEVLSWNGTDYDWVASSSGGGNVAVGSIMIWSGQYLIFLMDLQ